MYPSDEELDGIKALVDALEIVEAGTRRLCARDVDLAKADRIFEYILKELRLLDSRIAERLEAAVHERIIERRQKEASTLLAYLKDPTFLTRVSKGKLILDYANKTTIRTLAKDLYMRLFPTENQPQGDNITEDVVSPPPPKKSRSNDIEFMLEQDEQDQQKSVDNRASKAKHTSASILDAIKSDMKQFEARGERSTMLTKVKFTFRGAFCFAMPARNLYEISFIILLEAEYN